MQHYRPSRSIQAITLLAVAGAILAGWLMEQYEEENLHGVEPARYPAQCIRVIDGDTIDVIWGLGDRDRVRLLGVDCPETYFEEKLKRQARAWGLGESVLQDLGRQATELARSCLLHQRIELVFPEGRVKRDPHERMLCYVEYVKKDFGEDLIRKGLAEPRRERHQRGKRYKDLGELARKRGAGIYGKPGSVTTPLGQSSDAR